MRYVAVHCYCSSASPAGLAGLSHKPFLDFAAVLADAGFLADIVVLKTSRVGIPSVGTEYLVNDPSCSSDRWDVGTGCVVAQLSVSNPE